VAIVFLYQKYSAPEDKISQSNKTPPVPAPDYREEQDNCPYNEKSLTEIVDDGSANFMR